MNRRSTIKLITASGLIAAVGGGYFWLKRPREHSELALDKTVEKINGLPSNVNTVGAWNAARTFNHLAQSIEFSMTGYPVPKSAMFQNTVGQLAFNVFQARGQMSHALDEPIPGETIAATSTAELAARERLLKALANFDNFDGELQPHFAYGKLNKSQYAIAHSMHVNNHFEEFRNI